MDDADNIAVQALPVKTTGEEFDLDIPPTSAQDYLRRVFLEAKDCPDIVVASIDPRTITKKQTFIVSDGTGCQPCPAGLAPTHIWQRQQIADFSEVRQILANCKDEIKKKSEGRRPPLLDLDDVEGWCKLCFGRMVIDKHKKSDILPEGANGVAVERPTTFNYEEGTPPLLSIVSKMDQLTVFQVLEYHVNWFEATGFTAEQGRWFYALLASLQKPLSPEACSLLRKLSRNCWNLRATLSVNFGRVPSIQKFLKRQVSIECPRRGSVLSIDSCIRAIGVSMWREKTSDDPHLVPLNLIIALVGRYFDQTDMADQG